MKKVSIILAGNDEWTDVKNDRYPKWEFDKTPELIGILLEKHQMNGDNGPYLLCVIQHFTLKTKHTVFCSKVLEDRLKDMPMYSKVRIVFEGKHPTKRYHMFKVQRSESFKYDPSAWEVADDFKEVPATQQHNSGGQGFKQQPATNTNQGANNFSSAPADDDLPF